MNEHSTWWNTLDAVIGFAVGVLSLIGACFGWLDNRFKKMAERMDDMEHDFNKRNQLAATSIVRLEAYHESNTRRLDAIDETTNKIDEKLDRLLETMARRER